MQRIFIFEISVQLYKPLAVLLAMLPYSSY